MRTLKQETLQKTLFPFLVSALIISALLSTALGAASISFRETAVILLSRLLPFQSLKNAVESMPASHVHIILQIRLPRILTALVTGISLAVSGAVFQAVFRNPMADPFILGISSGSAFGVAVGIVSGMTALVSARWGVPVFAFLGGTLATGIIYGLSGKSSSTNTLLLSGIAMNFLLSSLMSLMLYISRDKLESIIYWNLGSFSSASWEEFLVILPWIVLGTAGTVLFTRELNSLSLGDETAHSLGISISNTRIALLILATVNTSASVAVSGTIGFTGLVIPHVVRLIIGPNHRHLIPCAAAGGALFMIICDAAARSLIPPTEIPVGIITAVTGAPYFIFLLKRRKHAVL